MNKMNATKVLVNAFTIVLIIITIVLFILNNLYDSGLIEALAITFLTITFHFVMRLIVGFVVSLFKKSINPNRKYYELKNFEKKLYDFLKVKKWKNKIFTYNPAEFDIEKNTMEQIAVNMCNSEKVHMVIFFLSYIPLLFIIPFGQPIVFVITSILSSIFDLGFVIVQRYNRPRVIRIMNKMKK